MKVTCPSVPNLLVTEPRVQFVDGVAEVSPEVAERLRAFAPHGVEVPPRPAKRTPAKKVTQ